MFVNFSKSILNFKQWKGNQNTLAFAMKRLFLKK